MQKIEIPSAKGVFYGEKQDPLALGVIDELMPTNAESGFGFAAPVGQKIDFGVNKFTIFNSDLTLRKIQISLYKGIAVNNDVWGNEVEDSNVAWISERVVHASVHVDENTPGLAEIKLNEPLEPGFYVIHDDSFVRADQKSDVSAYYPFVVTDRDGNTAWDKAADDCFKKFHDEMRDNLPLVTPKKIDRVQLVSCAMNQRVAWKAHFNESDAVSKLRLRAIYLARLFDANNFDNQLLIKALGKKQENALSDEIWRISQLDIIQRLAMVYAEATAGEKLNTDVVASIHAFYNDTIRNSEDKRLSEPIMALAWMPFVQLAPSEPLLLNMLESSVRHLPWESTLIETLGAIQYRRLLSMTQKNKAYAAWFKQVEHLAPASFRSGASSFSFRQNTPSIVFGPYFFENVPDDETSAWRATLMAQAEEARECLPQPYTGESAFFILEVPLNKTSITDDLHGVLRDPLADKVKRATLDPAAVSCIINAFSKIPALPSLDVEQKAYIAVSTKKNSM